jgi:hypothetical protein
MFFNVEGDVGTEVLESPGCVHLVSREGGEKYTSIKSSLSPVSTSISPNLGR